MIRALGVALLFGAAAAGPVLAQPAPAQNPPSPPMQSSMGPIMAQHAAHHDVRVHGISGDAFVVIKDVGDSQIVMVYRVDAAGKVQLSHKARFYY